MKIIVHQIEFHASLIVGVQSTMTTIGSGKDLPPNL